MGTGSSVRSLIQFILLVSIPVVLSSKFVNISRITKFSHNPPLFKCSRETYSVFSFVEPCTPGRYAEARSTSGRKDRQEANTGI